MSRYPTALAITLLAFASGCQSLTPKWPAWFSQNEKSKISESAYSKPARMAVIWSPAMLNTPGKKPSRGFGGRIYFYDGTNKAVPVEGQLVVYGYNDSKPNAGKTPDRTFAFTPEQFTTHFSPTDLGASYSVWIPWDEVGSDQVDVSLVPIFTATSGQLVIGQSSKALLPGPNAQANQTRIERFELPPPMLQQEGAAGPSAVQQASYQEAPPVSVQQMPGGNMQEMSIKLPGSMAERLANSPPQARRLPPLEAMGGPPVVAAKASTDSAPGPEAMSRQRFLANRPQLTRYGPQARPAPSSLGPRPVLGPPPSQPYLAGRPFGPPSAPPPGPQTASPGAW